jgi:hypothetical protein
MRRLSSWLLAVLALGGSPAALAAGALPPGCDAQHRAVAHYADGSAAVTATRGLRCVSRSGFGGAETHIRVTPRGTVLEEPATLVDGLLGTGFVPGAPGPHPQTQLSVAGFAVSRDAGGSWSFLEPGGATWVGQDASLHVDRATGRIYYYALAANPAPQLDSVVPVTEQVPSIQAHLLSSPDEGATWVDAAIPGFVNSENARFATGTAPAGQPQPATGERAAYWCGNTMQFVFIARLCYRSLDGGASWKQRSILFTNGVPRHNECGNHAEVFNSGDGNYPQAAPDGSLWVLVSCGGSVFLARSIDEGATWPIERRAGSSAPLQIPIAEELRVDDSGALYAVHLNGAALELRRSTDGGQTWTPPLDLTAPGARASSILQWALAVRGRGQVAVAYLAARPAGGYDGYISTVRDARRPQPVVFSLQVNDPAAALVTTPQSAKDDYIDLDLAPDGSPWAAFYSDCPADGSDATCAQAGSPNPLGKATTIARIFFRGAH